MNAHFDNSTFADFPLRRLALVAGAIFVVCCVAFTALADTIDPIESGREAFGSAPNMPWYDAEKDGVRRVEVRPPGAPPDRPNVEGVSRSPNQPRPLSMGGAGLWLLVQWAVIGLIAALLLFLLVLGIYYLASRGDDGSFDLPDEMGLATSDEDRIEQLPVPLKRNLSDLLGEARRQYEAGNYNEAIVYLYSYLLVELDKAQLIRLLRGKTNRQYLRELGDAPPTLSHLVERTMVAFEDAFFGDHRLEKARFESCYNHLSEFHQYVEPTAA